MFKLKKNFSALFCFCAVMFITYRTCADICFLPSMECADADAGTGGGGTPDNCTDTCSAHGWKDSAGACSYDYDIKFDNCRNTCYVCKDCTDTCSNHGWTSAYSTCQYGYEKKDKICNTQCYQCNACTPKECSGYDLTTKPASGGDTYDICDPGCDKPKLYKCASGYKYESGKCTEVKNCTNNGMYDTKEDCDKAIKNESRKKCVVSGKCYTTEKNCGTNEYVDEATCKNANPSYSCKKTSDSVCWEKGNCTDTCSAHKWKDSSGECSYGSTTRTDDCGNTCYECGECTSLANESQDVANCKTVSYQCSNGCGGTRTCYKSACGENQTCQSGTCVNNVCPNSYTELPDNMTADEFIWDYDRSQECDPDWNTTLQLASYCPYTLAYSGKSTNGKDCVKVVEKGCEQEYEEVPAGWTAESYLLNWIGANVGALAEQDCDPVMSQDIDVVCLYKLSYSGTSGAGRDCVKVVERTCSERRLYDTEEDCKSHTGMNCQKVGITGGVTDKCYMIKPSSGDSGGHEECICNCPNGYWYSLEDRSREGVFPGLSGGNIGGNPGDYSGDCEDVPGVTASQWCDCPSRTAWDYPKSFERTP